MKIALLYFTGTYNTLYLTTLISKKLKSINHEVDVFVLNNELKFNAKKYDIIGIGYPIHAFNSPKYLSKIIKNLSIYEKKYFIYKNSGEPFKYNNASSYEIYKIMKAKNNTLLGEYHFLMPYNILFETKKEFISYEMKYNLRYIKYMCENIEKIKVYKVTLFERFIATIFKIQRFGCKVNAKHYKVDKSKCIKCRKCIYNCPMHNIKYDKTIKKTVFGKNCVMCMRCSFTCPTNAISIGMLNKYKVTSYYDFNDLITLNLNYDFASENKKFYKKFKSYFDYIDSLGIN